MLTWERKKGLILFPFPKYICTGNQKPTYLTDTTNLCLPALHPACFRTGHLTPWTLNTSPLYSTCSTHQTPPAPRALPSLMLSVESHALGSHVLKATPPDCYSFIIVQVWLEDLPRVIAGATPFTTPFPPLPLPHPHLAHTLSVCHHLLALLECKTKCLTLFIACTLIYHDTPCYPA